MHMKTGSATLTLLLLAAASLASAQGAAPQAANARLDRIVSEAMQRQRIPAVTVAAMTGGRIVYSKGFGTADLENSVAATPPRPSRRSPP
jgi:CubicO group peptidase (beta-lactamase class C family)